MNQTPTKQQTMNLEVHVIPVSSVERSKEFYQGLGWRLDDDVAPTNDVRIVQFTPPGSGCSVTFGKGVTAAVPGSAVGALIVSDIKAAHDEFILRHRGECDVARRAVPPGGTASRPRPQAHELRVVLRLQ